MVWWNSSLQFLDSPAWVLIKYALQAIFWALYWAGQLKEGKGCRQTLDCYCVSCELMSASIADAILFVNILVSGIFHGRFAQQFEVNKPWLQIIRCLLWKQTTTHSLRNNNPMFDGNLCPILIDQPSISNSHSSFLRSLSFQWILIVPLNQGFKML